MASTTSGGFDEGDEGSGGDVEMPALLSWAELPGTVLDCLLRRYCDGVDAARIACVCRNWRAAVSDSQLWELYWRRDLTHVVDCRTEELEEPAHFRDEYRQTKLACREAAVLLESLQFPTEYEQSMNRLIALGTRILPYIRARLEETGNEDLTTAYFAAKALRRLQESTVTESLRKWVIDHSEMAEQQLEVGPILLSKLCNWSVSVPEVSRKIEQLGIELRSRIQQCLSQTSSTSLTIKEQIRCLNSLLFEGGLGLRGNYENYRLEDNSHLDRVLETKLGIPISLCAIYAAVGRRAGIALEMVGAPNHFLVKIGEDESPDEVFIDCFNNGSTLSRKECTLRLPENLGQSFRKDLLSGVDIKQVILRMCRNITTLHRDGIESCRSALRSFYDVILTLSPDEGVDRLIRSKHLLTLDEYEGALHDLDTLIGNPYTAPGVGPNAAKTLELFIDMRKRALELEAKFQRDHNEIRQERPQGLLWRVGQAFRHKRYHYRGVIYGWDSCCTASERWIVGNKIRELEYGKDQPFYKSLVDSRDEYIGSITYVAQENIQLEPMTESIQHQELGRYFKRFDAASSTYIPNEYLRMKFQCDFQYDFPVSE